MQVLATHIPEIIKNHDLEKGDQYQEIFLELGRNNIRNIVNNGDKQVLEILLDLMGIGCLNDDQLQDETGGERIKGRYQTSFWRDFIKHIS